MGADCRRALGAVHLPSPSTPKEQRVIKGAWQGKGPNKHIGAEMCEQEELRGFTKQQVYRTT